MTDSNQTTNSSSTSTQPGYEGSDSDLREQKDTPRSGISTVQVGASAAAAVTSALAASFFGVAGTLIGAAVGSIVSTIAGALYTDYLGRAHQRLRVTTDVVIQRIPGDVIATTPLRHLTSPTDIPGRESMQPIGAESGDETLAVPVEGATELLRIPEDKAVLEETSETPVPGGQAGLNGQAGVNGLAGSGGLAGVNGQAGANGLAGVNGQAGVNRQAGQTRHIGANGQIIEGGLGAHGQDGLNGAGRPSGEPDRVWWKKPAVALSAVSLAGFLIALGVVLATEGVLGHPVSGGTSGTSISKITGGGDSDTPKTEVTPTTTPSDSEAGTPSEGATEGDEPVAPTDSATEPDSEPTTAPDSSAGDEPAAPSTADANEGVAPEGTEAP